MHEVAGVLSDTIGERAPIGLQYFLLDNMLPSIPTPAVAPGATGTAELQPPELMVLLEPVFDLMGRASDEHTLQRAIRGVIDPLLDSASGAAEGGGGEGGEEGSNGGGGFSVDFAALSDRLFELAASKSTRAYNRKALYALQVLSRWSGRWSGR